jgi:formylglycine-generating enzyme required for sulfatase activity
MLSRMLIGFMIGALVSSMSSSAHGAEVTTWPLWDGKESVEEYGKRAGLKDVESIDLGDRVAIDFLLCPAGTFSMGSTATEKRRASDEPMEKQHKVTITQPFYLAKFELTQAQYEKIVASNPSTNKDPKLPVSNICWADADIYCQKASEKTKRTICLPTEAQWEYACRAGTNTAYYTGDDEAALDKAGWYGKNSERRPHVGGEKAPNSFGLFDMIGNVRELVSDFYEDYDGKDTVDPMGPATAEKHISRGGAYAALFTEICRCASRTPEPLTRKNEIIGMRPALLLPKK